MCFLHYPRARIKMSLWILQSGSLAAPQTRLLFKEKPLPVENVLFSGVTCSSVPPPQGVSGEGITTPASFPRERGAGVSQTRVAPTAAAGSHWHSHLLQFGSWVSKQAFIYLWTYWHKTSQNHFFSCSKNIFVSKFFLRYFWQTLQKKGMML